MIYNPFIVDLKQLPLKFASLHDFLVWSSVAGLYLGVQGFGATETIKRLAFKEILMCHWLVIGRHEDM